MFGHRAEYDFILESYEAVVYHHGVSIMRIIVVIAQGLSRIFRVLPLLAYVGVFVLMWGIIFHSKSFLLTSCALLISIYSIESAISYVSEQMLPKHSAGATKKKAVYYCFKTIRLLRLFMQFLLGGYIFCHYPVGWQWILGSVCIVQGGASMFAAHIYKSLQKIIYRMRADNTYTPSRVGVIHSPSLPYSLLRSHFEELAGYDDLAYISADKDFLSWNTQEFADVQIIKLDDDEWVSIFRISSKKYLGIIPIKSLLGSRYDDIAHIIRDAQPSGIVLYKKGEMTIYPREYKPIYKDKFMDTLICPEQKFSRWLKRYTD